MNRVYEHFPGDANVSFLHAASDRVPKAGQSKPAAH